jgi:hypothetical protein
MGCEYAWQFWIPFAGDRLGGVAVTVRGAILDAETAVGLANNEAMSYVRNLERGDADGLCIYPASDAMFSADDLAEVECTLDAEQAYRLEGESSEDFLARVRIFLDEHESEEA